MIDLELARKYKPTIMFDKNEPFFPIKVGYTLFRESGKSSAYPRQIEINSKHVAFAIEYAIYWDFDIQHLYELEHIWVYVGHQGEVVDCEGSFHGRYFKGLLRTKENLDGTNVVLYSQPGKHAFLPKAEYFDLVPDLISAPSEEAGKAGLIVTSTFQGVYQTSDEINEKVKAYLQQFRFTPSMEFDPYEIPDDIFMEWEKLFQEIPRRIQLWLNKM